MRARSAGQMRKSEARPYFTIKKTFPQRKFLYDWEQSVIMAFMVRLHCVRRQRDPTAPTRIVRKRDEAIEIEAGAGLHL